MKFLSFTSPLALREGQIGSDIPPREVGEGDKGEAILVPETGCGLNIGLRSIMEAEGKKEDEDEENPKTASPNLAPRERPGILEFGPLSSAAAMGAESGGHFTRIVRYSVS